MKMKRFISAFAALAMSVSCFAGLAITANAADPVDIVNIDFSNASYGFDENTEIGTAATGEAEATGMMAKMPSGVVIAGSAATNKPIDSTGKWLKFDQSFANSLIVTLSDEQLNSIGDNDQVTVSFDVAYGNLNKSYVWQELIDTDGNTTTQFRYSRYSGIDSARNDMNVSASNFKGSGNTGLASYRVHYEYIWDNARKSITLNVTPYNNGTAGSVETYTKTDVSAKFKTFKLTTNYNNSGRYSLVNNIHISTKAGEAVQLQPYTIKYVDEEGNEIKDSRTPSGEVGSSATISDAVDKVKIDKDGDRYFYDSDDSDGKTINGDGSTIVTVTFRKSAKYTMNAIAKIGETSAGTLKPDTVVFEDDTFSYSYPKYLTNDKNEVTASCNETIYTKSTSNPTESKTFEVAYTAYNGTAYFREIESIKDHTNYNTSAAVSSGAGARTIDNPEAALTITKPGIYKITVVGYCRNSSDNRAIKVYKNGLDDTNLIGNDTVTGSQNTPTTKYFENVRLSANDAIFLTGETGNTYGDYIFIEKTGDIPPTAEVKDEALFQPVNPATGEQEKVSFDDLTKDADLQTKTIAVTIYNTDATLPTMSINGGTEFTPAWTAKTNETAGTRTFYAQFMAAEDDFDEFGTVVVKYGEQTVLSQTLVTNSDPTP